jgi:hypothetical protein
MPAYRLSLRRVAGNSRTGTGTGTRTTDRPYIASGLLLYGLGQLPGKRWGAQEGAGVAMAGQGAFLLGFDLVVWFSANRRADSLRVLR